MRLQETSISLDRSSYRYHYLCHYRPIAAGMDTLSRSLMKFKRGAHPDLDAWIDYARAALAEIPPPRDTILLRALGHRELTAQNTRPSSLDLLCRTLSLDFGCRYLPTLLSKSRETPGNKTLSRAERETQLLDVYSADIPPSAPANHPPDPGHPFPPSTPILLVDDILTTGATIRAIIAALRRKYTSCPIRIFTLGKASNAPLRHNITPLRSPNYHFDPQSGWVRAGTRENPDQPSPPPASSPPEPTPS